MNRTEGPWFVDYDEVDDIYYVDDAGGKEWIATVHYRGDTRLIAAAPEMLNALIHLCRDEINLELAVGMGISAIEKATGKTWDEIEEEQ